MPDWIEHIKTWSEFRRFLTLSIAITTIVGGVAFSASKWYIKHQLEKNREDVALQDELSKFNEMLEYASVERGFLLEDNEWIKDSLEKLEEKQENQGKSINYLAWMFRNQNTFTPEQMEILLDEWVKKI